MKIFISHGQDDQELAGDLAALLTEAGNEVFDPERDLLPGDNWARRIGEALEGSDAMVMLVSPDSVKSRWFRRDLQFALGAANYDRRLIPVLVRPTDDIPWILRRIPSIQVGSDRADVTRQIIEQLRLAPELTG